MEEKLSIWFDKEGDYFEITFGKPRRGHFQEIEDDVLERIDDETGEVIGFAILNFSKMFDKLPKKLIQLPLRKKFKEIKSSV